MYYLACTFSGDDGDQHVNTAGFPIGAILGIAGIVGLILVVVAVVIIQKKKKTMAIGDNNKKQDAETPKTRIESMEDPKEIQDNPLYIDPNKHGN